MQESAEANSTDSAVAVVRASLQNALTLVHQTVRLSHR
jgi:hypothetical protein